MSALPPHMQSSAPQEHTIDFVDVPATSQNESFTGTIPERGASYNSSGIRQQTSSNTASQRFGFDQGLAGALFTSGMSTLKDRFSTWKNENVSMRQLKSWSLFTKKTAFSIPKPNEVVHRVKANLMFFQTNYIAILIGLSLYSILTNMALLFAIVAVAGLAGYLLYWRTAPLVVGSRQVTDREKLIGIGAVAVLLLWLTSATETIFWILGVTLTVVALHSLLYSPAEENDFDFNTSYMNTVEA
ncbi:hypothetical protein PROFUN_05687 [Planoprotostelium fungivorum]|uniref:PRA1 family protein n=1 Tax=Planoprotostelium fungivorum TaxID=1890364 RepID=A0A2P6NQD9_9EUKA|nr:hypothetical protein PROFUN_05687 [Planoprotostelium fungivorum]